MKVIILAAGRGSRLGKRTADKPKCMCMLSGRTILDRCLESISKAGFKQKDIAIVTGYKKEMFTVKDVTYFHNSNWENTNMFTSLTMAEEWLKNEKCIVCYSDVVFSSEALKLLSECDSELALTYYTEFMELWKQRMDDPLSDLETFKMDSDNILTEIGKKTKSEKDIEGQYMGLILFTPESWEWVQKTISRPLPKPVQKLDMTTLLQGLIEDGRKIKAIPTSELWLECDTEQDIDVYEKIYKQELE